MSIRVSCWTIFGTILICLTIPCLIFAHAFPYWQQTAKERESDISHLGLWETCFPEDGAAAPPEWGDGLGKRYYGCVYNFDRDMRDIVDAIYQDWFIAVAAFLTLGLLLQPVGIIFNILYYVRVCSPHYEHILILVSCILNWLCGLVIAIAIFIFGIYAAKQGIDWVPTPESYHLSYSYGVCALVPVLCFLAGMSHTVDFLRMKSFRDRNARAKVYTRGEFGRY